MIANIDFSQITYTWLKIVKDDHLLWITLNRPDNSNAFSLEMIEELCDVLPLADKDHSTRVIIITGEGKCFCAGGDIKSMQKKEEMFAGAPNELKDRYSWGIQEIPRVMERLQTPTIAMINGPAIGAGLDFACMCDLRIASLNSRFGETFSKLALVSGDGGGFFLQRIVGHAKAMELSLTAKVIDAQTAFSIGLVNDIVESNSLEEKTKRMALQIASNSPIAVSMMKKAIKHGHRSGLNEHLDLVAAYQGITQRTEDHFEGLNALINKRDPNFGGQ